VQQLSLLRQLFALARRECLTAVRSPAQWLNPVLFFLIVISLFPLGVGPEPDRLAQISVGTIWVVALLASTLGAGQFFESDFHSGLLEQFVLSPVPMYWVVQVKLLTHWLLIGLPLTLLVPLLGLMVFLPTKLYGILMVTVLLGMPVIVSINAVGAALTLAARGKSVLLLLICLPLQIPVIIFATGAVQSYEVGFEFQGYLMLLAGLLLLSLALMPLAIAAALRISVLAR